MREHDGGVDDTGVDELKGAEVVLEAVADEDGVRVDEAHHVVLNLPQGLRRTSLQIPSADPRKPGVVIEN